MQFTCGYVIISKLKPYCTLAAGDISEPMISTGVLIVVSSLPTMGKFAGADIVLNLSGKMLSRGWKMFVKGSFN
jgi:hypothetical protein